MAARAAATRFVRDYTFWSASHLRMIPRDDATARVIRLLERQPRIGSLAGGEAVWSLRIAAAAQDRYLVTSAVGNFLVGRVGFRWLVISLPGY